MTLNMEDGIELEARLYEWAGYIRSGNNGLGFPSRSMLGRLMEEGGVLNKGHGTKLYQENLKAQQIEDWVCQFANVYDGQYKKFAKTLRIRYLAHKEDTNAWLARKHGISPRMFKHHLQLAKLWLEAVLSQQPSKNSNAVNKSKFNEIELDRAASF